MKSGLVARGLPRSSATIESPVSPSSLARMPPVQPRPTMTMSTPLSRVAIVVASTEILDALGLDIVFLIAVVLDLFDEHADCAGEADHLPHRLVLVAAIERIAEIPLHSGLQEHVEERARRHLRELRL